MLNKYTGKAIAQRLLDGNVRDKLCQIEQDDSFNTCASSYSANIEMYPDNQIPFIDKHIAYLMAHPQVDYDQYLSNLRLMLKVRK